MIKRRTFPPSRGPRFVADPVTRTAHDRARVFRSCELGKMPGAVEAATLAELRGKFEGLRLHKDCFGVRP